MIGRRRQSEATTIAEARVMAPIGGGGLIHWLEMKVLVLPRMSTVRYAFTFVHTIALLNLQVLGSLVL
jgi:hypothetical protein